MKYNTIGAVMAGLFCLFVASAMAGPAYAAELDSLSVSAAQIKEDAKKIESPVGQEAGCPVAAHPKEPVEFIPIGGGTFMMGTERGDSGSPNSTPAHSVRIKAFDISKTLVTVAQYGECVHAGKCDKPGSGDAGNFCNWGKKDRARHPINCVNWKDANDFAAFKDARLPSEAEYEYAATSRGKKIPHPWGKGIATCDNAVMFAGGGYGCGNSGTMPVCSKPKGNTEQDLCDMVGNVWQWVGDTWHDTYKGAPSEGSAWQAGNSPRRVMRGGSFSNYEDAELRVTYRNNIDAGTRYVTFGFRLAKSRP